MAICTSRLPQSEWFPPHIHGQANAKQNKLSPFCSQKPNRHLFEPHPLKANISSTTNFWYVMIGLGPDFFSFAGRFFRWRRRDAVVHDVVDRAHASLSSSWRHRKWWITCKPGCLVWNDDMNSQVYTHVQIMINFLEFLLSHGTSHESNLLWSKNLGQSFMLHQAI